MEKVINPHFLAHLYYEQHPDSREAQLMRCMETLEKIATAKDRRDSLAGATWGGNYATQRLAAYKRLIKILQTKYDAQIKTLELFGNPEQLEK
jgi:predicted esterase YcpF (UPF0227 family)